MGGSDNDKMNDFKSSYYEKEEEGSKFLAKAKENPFVPLGITAALGALAYSAYKFKHRGNQKLSVYLIHTRVAAQGAIVTALTMGVAIQMYREFVLGEAPPSMRQKPK